MVVDRDAGAAGTPQADEALDYVEAMALQLALICEQAGALRAALKLREAALMAGMGASQPPEAKAAPGGAA